jgi:isoamylase
MEATNVKIWPGQPYPLGATYDGAGTNFSVFSEAAERVDLCLFDEDGNETQVTLPEVSGLVWHGYLPNIRPEQRYGYRAYGPWLPEHGQRCSPHKLLLDPYAKAIEGEVKWNAAVFSYNFGDPEGPPNNADSAPFVPKSIVISPYFDWGNDRSPDTPWHETIIYEVHVKGFTASHPDIPSDLRGTYTGLAHPVALNYLTGLGITAVELMPVHQFIHDARLAELGLRNYWGYNSIGYLAPHNGYASTGQLGQQVTEFKQMVKTLHEEGIEVILDVVYNHTAEGNHLGPTLAFKGLDNASYYRLMPDDPRHYMDYTGTGNTLNMRHPHVLQLIMDSLRYWVLDMHVDGFRFDLAATLARELHAVNQLSAFLNMIQQDPVISQVKLIAEPWDLGEGGYQVGNFPPLWSEWNGKYRDTVRDFWRGEDETLAEFASRFTGSSDLYASTGRVPYASINFVTAHDGFTLHDLVSYNEKHNEANGEGNRDGESHNRSWNCGVEGPTNDAKINALRSRQKRNFLANLFLSQGVPMLLGGDEFGRTQRGNNNAYCQDNDIAWFDWEHLDTDLLAFTRYVIDLRRQHPVFKRRRWFQGRPIYGSDADDIGWFTPAGNEMSEEDWNTGFAKSLGVFLNGEGIAAPDPRGERVIDDSFYILFNSHHEAISFHLPARDWGREWIKVLDTYKDTIERRRQNGKVYKAGQKVMVPSRSLLVMRRIK